MKKCDLGILLGGPILEQPFNKLIQLINTHLKETQNDDETLADHHQSTKRLRVEGEEPDHEFPWMPIPVIDPTKAIERIACPAIEEFLTNYMQRKRPVILTGCIDHWPALQKWR